MTFLDSGSFAVSALSPNPLTEIENPKLEPATNFPELLIVEDKLQDSFRRADGIIKETCSRLLSSGGKRLRLANSPKCTMLWSVKYFNDSGCRSC